MGLAQTLEEGYSHQMDVNTHRARVYQAEDLDLILSRYSRAGQSIDPGVGMGQEGKEGICWCSHSPLKSGKSRKCAILKQA